MACRRPDMGFTHVWPSSPIVCLHRLFGLYFKIELLYRSLTWHRVASCTRINASICLAYLSMIRSSWKKTVSKSQGKRSIGLRRIVPPWVNVSLNLTSSLEVKAVLSPGRQSIAHRKRCVSLSFGIFGTVLICYGLSFAAPRTVDPWEVRSHGETNSKNKVFACRTLSTYVNCRRINASSTDTKRKHGAGREKR